ncbi:MAG TPA: DUF116 domain-containing protein [Candidatus Limnocylindrales bacterium]|nr:DUF116 domain-containing protein [Candidatus Limnocylindrales bacterium]
MPYKFTFDLSKLPHFFFTEIATVSYQKGMHRTFIKKLQEMNSRFKIQEATGLNLSDALVLLEDFIDLQAVNMIERGKFLQTKKRALFLPHCSRKFLDNRCKATFSPEIPSYTCSHCSEDCLVNQSVKIASNKGYDVYVVPGGSCIPKILKNTKYEGIVGVACGEEIKMFAPFLGGMDVAGQAIPLIKNGCANTIFNVETLVKVL